MKYFLILCLLFSLILGGTLSAKQPNILFIMSDDHTTQAIGAYGSRLAKLNPTPSIDALAKGGMRFDRVFCNNSICTPSRASILTGQYSQTNGVLDLGGRLPPQRQFLPAEMRKAGYHTAMVGKWHLKEEPAAFHYYCVLPNQGSYYDPVFRVRGSEPWTKNTVKKRGHSSDIITDISLEWLKNDWNKAKPFFLMHHFKAPHDMFHNAKRYDGYLANVTIPEPHNLHNQPAATFGSRATRDFGAGVTKNHSSWNLGGRLGIEKSLAEPSYGQAVYQKYVKRYLRCVKGVDDNVRRLLDYLEQTGEIENTVIMYTGDQGFFLGEHDFMDKRWMYEEAMRMPFIVHFPQMVSNGSTNDWLINNTDFAPTILELAGAKTPPPMQGRSFVAALNGALKPDDWRTSTYYRYWMHMAHQLRVPAHFGIRSDRYKLIFFYGCSPSGGNTTPAAWEFYDLRQDPFEMNNQYGFAKYEGVIADMKAELERTRQSLNETDEKYPAIQTIINAHWRD
ncbi:MAG: sulfatase [Pirellulaceae bacterium]